MKNTRLTITSVEENVCTKYISFSCRDNPFFYYHFCIDIQMSLYDNCWWQSSEKQIVVGDGLTTLKCHNLPYLFVVHLINIFSSHTLALFFKLG
jgi:hypothetical protein